MNRLRGLAGGILLFANLSLLPHTSHADYFADRLIPSPSATLHFQSDQWFTLPPPEGPVSGNPHDLILANSHSIPEPYAYLLAAIGVVGLLSMGRVMRRRNGDPPQAKTRSLSRKPRTEILGSPNSPARRHRTSRYSRIRNES